MTKTLNIAVLGADGRMGRAVMQHIVANPLTMLCGAITNRNSRELGADAGRLIGRDAIGITLEHDMKAALSKADVLIDFSAPSAVIDAALLMHDTPCTALVSGTTGLSRDEEKALATAASNIALLRSGNFSMGVNMLEGLVELAAAKLRGGWDIEILDMHHRHKVDAPSGTAIMLGQAAARGRGADLDAVKTVSREGISAPREEGQIGFAALRGGGVVGEHDVRIANELEMLSLSHTAFDRSVFAVGAVEAALWAARQPKGRYDMKDVLGLR